jgi:hypothetical protein
MWWTPTLESARRGAILHRLALRHEKYLFLAAAGPYAKSEQPLPLLADRIEGLISQEHAKWLSAQEQAEKSREKNQAKGS